MDTGKHTLEFLTSSLLQQLGKSIDDTEGKARVTPCIHISTINSSIYDYFSYYYFSPHRRFMEIQQERVASVKYIQDSLMAQRLSMNRKLPGSFRNDFM